MIGCMAAEMSAPAAFPPAVRWRWALRRTTTRSPSRCRSRGTSSPYSGEVPWNDAEKARMQALNKGMFPSTMPLW